MADTLKIRSLNANGMQCKKKRDLVFNELTKYNQEVLLLQETHTNVSDEKHYKTKWGKNVFFSHGTTNSRGVCIIIPKTFNGDCEKIYADPEGRLLIVKITIEKVDYVICNIYAPVSSYENEQIDLLMLLEKELEEYINSNLILGGDWNVHMNDNLDKKSKAKVTCTNKKYRESLITFLQEYSMVDCWRLAHPNLRKYTCRSGKRGDRVTFSRIDMIIVKESLLNVMEKTMIKAGFMSDHNFTTLTISVNNEARGPGTWKFNNMLLRDKTYVNMIKEMMAKEIEENNKYEDKGFLWDYIKMRVRSETMIFCGKLQKEKKANMKILTDEIENLDQQYMDHPSDDTYQQLDTAKRELEDINKEKLLSSVFRSKCEWAEHGERNSKYFLNLEKQNYTNKHITSLKVDKENITKGPKILKEIHTYYKKLYDHNRIDEVKLEEVLKDVPKLSEMQKNSTKGLITYDECLKALKSLSNGKTPGLDGITTDFYKKIWNDVSTTVLDSINNAFEKNEMSTDQRAGLITLSPKKNKLRSFLKNWRPITLLTVDYKLLAKALALRLKDILPDYIDESQFGYIKDRYIGENIRCVIDLNTMCKMKNIEAYAIQIDFEKAFDSVNWEFMLKSLEHMNFDKDFVRWVKILYNNTNSCVANNGHKTEVFNLRRGVHQGCPLSALLFIILVQVLQQMLKNNNNIEGIKVGNEEVKILQMADDTTILTKNIRDIPRILETLNIFYEISGLKTNIEKTMAYKLGNNQNYDHPDDYMGLTWGKPPIKLLGIAITDNIEDLKRENFSKKLEGIETVSKIWAARNLSMKGKLTIINSILIPKLIYPSTVLDVPGDIIKIASDLIKTFLWNWKSPKIKVDVLIRKIEQGGIKYPCLDCKIKSWKTLWAIRALKFEDKTPLWVRIVNSLLPTGITLNYLLKCKPTKKMLDTFCPYLPVFYKEIVLNWTELNKQVNYITKETIKKKVFG